MFSGNNAKKKMRLTARYEFLSNEGAQSAGHIIAGMLLADIDERKKEGKMDVQVNMKLAALGYEQPHEVVEII
ncbi:hypothetical protein ACFL6Y_05630 [Elusimicrobiota bacterium]